jgi:hypothetical protein
MRRSECKEELKKCFDDEECTKEKNEEVLR